ncbi:thermonuclease family protein [Nocardioides sp. P5_C9_2]
MRRLVTTLTLLLSTVAVLVAGALVGSVVPAQAGVTARFADMDCSDFPTQADAQAFFLAAGPGDPHRLDAEGDGLACESNPCPCTGSAPVPLVGQSTTPTPAPAPAPAPASDPSGSGSSGPVQRHTGTVVRVTDGDTLKVRVAGVGIRDVRILGIDTPEVYFQRECGGADASARMAELAPVGSRVVLTSDSSQADRDRYGRWLRYVARRGTDVGKAQLRAGLATTYVYRGNPFTRTRAYRRVEARAERSGRGLWSRCWS